ncbi:MAG TPA: alpha/beta fold hydrolase [Noviherbaspirillum sp.]
MRTLSFIIAMSAIAAGIFLVLVYYWQSSMILLPGIQGGSSDVLAQCGPGSKAWRKGDRYLGKVCEPSGEAQGTIVVYHGNAGTVDDRAFLASELTARGFRVVLAEYPGFGAREGSATIRQVLDASLDDFEVAQATWPAPLYILGESFGTGIAAVIAKRHPDNVAGLLLITPWDSLANVVNALFPLPLAFLLYERFDNVAALSAYRGNVVIVAAGRDEVLPVRHARALAKATPSAAYIELPHAGHNDWPAHLSESDWRRMIGFMAKGTR